MARKQKSSKPERQQAILAQLRATPAIRINELAASFAVSTETSRRDLDEMSSVGLISRTYGGATGTLQLSEPPLSDRYGINESERNAMASAVAALVEDGDSLMIDSGSTTIFVARRLAADPAHVPTMLHYAQKLLDWRLTHQERTMTNMHVGTGGLFSRP